MTSIREQLMDKCVHFTGIDSTQCKIGVVYKAVKGDGFVFPCFKNTKLTGGNCDKARFPSEEEIAEEEAKIKERATAVRTLLMDIKYAFKKTGKREGKIKCNCGGTIYYLVSTFNNHVHAQCNKCDKTIQE